MLYNWSEVLEIYKNQYQIKKAIREKKLFNVMHGIYSDKEHTNELEVITKKYPNAIFTLNSAYYFYDLTDVIPEKHYIAIEIHQKVKLNDEAEIIYMSKDLHELGITTLETHGATINIYDKEKLLIELVRNKNNFGYDFYKEIINNYRKIAYDLDIYKIEQYLQHYANKKNLLLTIKDEVY